MTQDTKQGNFEKIPEKPKISGEVFDPEKSKSIKESEKFDEFEGGSDNLEKQEQKSGVIPLTKKDTSELSNSTSATDPEVKEIENILAEDLVDIYKKLSPEKQMEFKKKGEETAVQINLLLKNVKIKVKEILGLIRDWLKVIPGVNKFFLEQEAKIKTDKLLSENKTKNSK